MRKHIRNLSVQRVKLASQSRRSISACPSSNDTRPMIAKIVRREVKFSVMTSKKKLLDLAVIPIFLMMLHFYERKSQRPHVSSQMSVGLEW